LRDEGEAYAAKLRPGSASSGGVIRV
jgi:hypothetical protein